MHLLSGPSQGKKLAWSRVHWDGAQGKCLQRICNMACSRARGQPTGLLGRGRGGTGREQGWGGCSIWVPGRPPEPFLPAQNLGAGVPFPGRPEAPQPQGTAHRRWPVGAVVREPLRKCPVMAGGWCGLLRDPSPHTPPEPHLPGRLLHPWLQPLPFGMRRKGGPHSAGAPPHSPPQAGDYGKGGRWGWGRIPSVCFGFSTQSILIVAGVGKGAS